VTSHDESRELRPAYRTLNEPTRLLGLPIAGWAALLIGGAVAYGWLKVSPLPWRANFSLVVIGLGAPVGLLALREPGTIGPGRLLRAVLCWRVRPPLAVCPVDEHPVRGGAVRLDMPAQGARDADVVFDELPWATDGADAVEKRA
jgi:hypothetical protein